MAAVEMVEVAVVSRCCVNIAAAHQAMCCGVNYVEYVWHWRHSPDFVFELIAVDTR